jgi:hypothetical protein
VNGGVDIALVVQLAPSELVMLSVLYNGTRVAAHGVGGRQIMDWH